MSQPGFFDFEERLASLSKAGDPLEGLAQTVDFEIFRKPLDKALKYSDRKKGGRPPYDAVAQAVRLNQWRSGLRCLKS